MKINSWILPIVLAIIISGCSSSENEPTVDEPNFNDQSILDIAWDLRQFPAIDGSEKIVPAETKYQILLDSATQVLTGFVGCVNTLGSYQLTDSVLLAILGASDDQECITDIEEFGGNTAIIVGMLGTQPNGENYLPLMVNRQNDILTLTAADGRALVFERISELAQQM